MNRKYVAALLTFSVLSLAQSSSVFGAVCPSSSESLVSAAERYESGAYLSFESSEDFLSFISWYLTQYRLKDMAASDYRMTDGKSRLAESGRYDREKLKKKILDSFSPLSGISDQEKIEDACRQIRSLLSYDPQSLRLSLDQALDSGTGVCWHFAKIASVLLTEAGIPSEPVFGTMGGTSHMWLCCRTEAGSVWADPQTGIISPSDLCLYQPSSYLSADSIRS